MGESDTRANIMRSRLSLVRFFENSLIAAK